MTNEDVEQSIEEQIAYIISKVDVTRQESEKENPDFNLILENLDNINRQGRNILRKTIKNLPKGDLVNQLKELIKKIRINAMLSHCPISKGIKKEEKTRKKYILTKQDKGILRLIESNALKARKLIEEIVNTSDLKNMLPNELCTLLDKTVNFGTVKDLQKLLNAGMDIEQTDHMDRTALQIASALGKKEMVEMLLERGANVNSIVRFHGRIPLTALDAARDRNNKEIIKILLSHGAKTGRELTE